MSAPDPSIPTCPDCGQRHVTPYGHQACTKHRSKRGPAGELLPCAKPPVDGTDACTSHGAAKGTPARAAADRRVEEQVARRELVRLGQKIPIDPGRALVDLVHWTAGEVEFWRQKVVALADADESLTWGKKSKVKKTSGQWPGTDTTFAAGEPVEYRLMVDASNRLAAYSAAALKAGVDERRVRIEEAQGAVVVGAIQRILDGLYAALVAAGVAPEVLADAWRAAVSEVVPRELRAAALGGAA